MKYCAQWSKTSKILDEVDEIKVDYKREDTSLLDFIKLHNNQRIIINTSVIEPIDLELFLAINKEVKNFTIVLNEKNDEIISKLKLNRVPFMLKWYIEDWETLHAAAALEVSDVYIVEALGFELDKVADFCHQNNILVRVFPNVCQLKDISTLPKIKGFFIRPEDIDVYAQYVDICEIFGDPKFEDVVYKAYAKDKQWFGEIKEIIAGFKEDLDNRFIIPRFAERRIKCNRKCLKGEKCQLCDRVESLSHSLKEANMFIKYNKNEEKEDFDTIMNKWEVSE